MKKARTEAEDAIRRKIKSRQALYDMDNGRLSIKLHMSLQSLERRLAHPNQFKLAELLRLEEVLNMELIKK